MASKKKVSLADYDLTITLGTGKLFLENSKFAIAQNQYIGSFGRVRLSKNKKTGEYFAMKILKKADIIKLKQVDHVISENTILADIEHPFLVIRLVLIRLGWTERLRSRQQVLVLLNGLYSWRRTIYLLKDGRQAECRPRKVKYQYVLIATRFYSA